LDRPLDPAVRQRLHVRQAAPWVGGGVLLLLLLLLVPALLSPSPRWDQIRTSVVDRGLVEAVLEASGTVVPATEVVFSSPIDARVVRVLKRPGETVRQGEEILELDVSEARLECDRLADQVESRANAKKRLGIELDEQLQRLQSQIAVRELDLQILTFRAQRKKKLFDIQLTTEEDLRGAETEVQKAQVEIEQLRESLKLAKRSTAAQMEGVALEMSTLRKDGAEARRRLDLASTKADRDGVVSWVVQDEGATVRRGDALARISDLTAFRVEATLSDLHSGRLQTGMPVRVVVENARLNGILTKVNPTVENGAVRFTVELEDRSNPCLRSNRRVDVLVVTESKDGVLRIKKGPFAHSGATEDVFVTRGNSAVRRPVRLGMAGYDDFEVVDGLREGDRVIISDMERMRHLSKVRIRGRAPASDR
jgi:HlyD family secretion protein